MFLKDVSLAVYSELEKLRAYFDSLPVEARIKAIQQYEVREIEVDSNLYIQSAWLDQVDGLQILVVQAQKGGFVSSSNFCLGSKFLRNGSVEHLNNEQLWNLGIP